MNPIALRIYSVLLVIAAIYGVNRLVQAGVAPPEVELPPWTVRDLPRQLGDWRGENTKLDPQVAIATGAQIIEDRFYLNNAGQSIALHTAMFHNPANGVRHHPLLCYNANGWKLRGETRETVRIADDLSIVVSLTTWEKETETILVAYWYQLGRHLLYNRVDMGATRWAMRGSPKWPVMIKIMAQISVTSTADEAKAAVLEFVGRVGAWLNQPEHRKYLDQWQGDCRGDIMG